MQGSGKEVCFKGRLVVLGFGSIGKGVLPLIFRHIEISPQQMLILTADECGRQIAEEYGVLFQRHVVTRGNYQELLGPLLQDGDFLLNLSINVGSLELIELCARSGALYLDTCVEAWEGFYTDAALPVSRRSNYALREEVLRLGEKYRDGPTAVIAHGANPGLVSHFVKQALMNMASDSGLTGAAPWSRDAWASLSRELGIRTIHVAERDTQVALPRKVAGEFVNTWSVNGLIAEGCQPAELGWGSHERSLPADGRHYSSGCQAAIFLNRPGAATMVRSWVPLAGPQIGYLITHNESISLADYLTIGSGENPEYRPTVHYAYHPSDDTMLSLHELQGRNWQPQEKQRLVSQEIVSGIDELGVLLMGHGNGVYWYGSRLSIEESRTLAPFNSATSLQVTAGVLGGMIWAIRHPERGIVEPEEMDFDEVLAVACPYLGKMVGVYSDWNPLMGRSAIFPEDIDEEDPWQFKNFRVL
ncbi:MAG: saccharopine dehydrogenase C-terminal domain-containing protein [Pseudomonadota bacterium]